MRACWELDKGATRVAYYPELARIPVLTESFHGQRRSIVKIVFGLELHVLELLGSGVAFAVELLESVDCGCGELSDNDEHKELVVEIEQLLKQDADPFIDATPSYWAMFFLNLYL